jgi:hypothetical protein
LAAGVELGVLAAGVAAEDEEESDEEDEDDESDEDFEARESLR